MKILDADRSDIWFTFDSEEERDSLSHMGECYNDCAYMVDSNLALLETIPRENAIKALKTLGAWNIEELTEMDNRELYIKIVWIAAGNARDENSLESSLSTY